MNSVGKSRENVWGNALRGVRRDGSGTQVELPSGWGMKSSSLAMGTRAERAVLMLARR